MPKNEIPEATIEECTEVLYDKLDDTSYTQQASADAWGYIAALAMERRVTILSEIPDGEQ